MSEKQEEKSKKDKSKKENKDFSKLLESFQIEIDPNEIESSIKELKNKVRQFAQDSRHTKVRIKFRGKALMPDLPLGVFVAAEAATFWYAGLLRALAVNLGMRAFVQVELIHASEEKVAEGCEHYRNGDVEDAEACFREALEMRSQDPAANYHMGVLLRVIGRREEALAHLKIAAEAEEYENAEKAQEILDKMNRGTRTL